jgi:phage head maturation protease
MGWLRSLFVGSEPDLATVDNGPAAQFEVEVPAELLEAMTAGGAIAPRISRNEALQVPAVLRARNLICTPATLPLRYVAPDRSAQSWSLFDQIDPDVPNSVVWAQTYEDLLFEGIAWWKVTAFGWHGYPVNATHVPVGSVHVAGTGALTSARQIGPDQAFPVEGQIYIDGLPVPDNQVIRFDSPNPPLLRHAARAIRTCLTLDQAVQLYAQDPMPLGYFSPEEDAEPLEDTEVQKRLGEWELSRRRHAWGYIAGWKPNLLQWDPEKLQLADQRQHAVLEIARACGIDPEDLGVSTTSRTYQNSEQRRQDLIDFTLGAWVSAVQDRLSMGDVTPRGYKARVDFGGFLRGDTKTRMETYKVGREVGAYTAEEVRELENRPSLTAAGTADGSQIAADLAALIQKIYLGTPDNTVITQREARAILNRAGAGLDLNAGEIQAPPPDDRKPARKMAAAPGAQFSDDDGLTVTFDDDEVYESFSVDADRRTISGLLVPWGKVAWAGMSKWKFAEGSLRWSSPKRVKLNLHHERQRIIAYATRLTATSRGLEGTFKVGSDAESEQALHKARDGLLDGFSIEVGDRDGIEWEPDPSDESVRLVSSAPLTGAALTGTPSFDDARVAAVAASRDQEKVDAPQGKDGRQDRHDGQRRQPSPGVRVRSRYVRRRSGEGGG